MVDIKISLKLLREEQRESSESAEIMLAMSKVKCSLSQIGDGRLPSTYKTKMHHILKSLTFIRNVNYTLRAFMYY